MKMIKDEEYLYRLIQEIEKAVFTMNCRFYQNTSRMID